MKSNLTAKLEPSKLLAVCGLGILITLGGFWHHQYNQSSLDQMSLLGQGVSTCFVRVSQTFTASMIKSTNSPYLERGFQSLSEECLKETLKAAESQKGSIGSKGLETLNKLNSEVHWFHEKVSRLTPEETLSAVSDRFTKMEELKVALTDEVDSIISGLRSLQRNDEILMGAGMVLFILGLSLLALQEYQRIEARREIEKEALNLLNAEKSRIGAMVDSLIGRALESQQMSVATQVFRDYHLEILERQASGRVSRDERKPEPVKVTDVSEDVVSDKKTSLKEVLVSLQNVHPEALQMADVRDVNLAVDYENCEMMMNAAVNKLAEKREGHRRIQISNQIHSDRAIINFFLSGTTFDDSELQGANADMNLMIMKEMAQESNTALFLENKTDRSGAVTGMTIRMTLKRAQKEKNKLVSVIRGKKKDLRLEV